MYVKKEAIKYILERHRVVAHIVGLLIVNIFAIVNIWVIEILLRDVLISSLHKRVDIIKSVGYNKPITFCSALNCTYIIKLDNKGKESIYKYNRRLGNIEEVQDIEEDIRHFFLLFFKNIIIEDKENNIAYYIDTNGHEEVLIMLAKYIISICNIVWILFSFVVAFYIYRSSKYRKKLDSMYIEDKLSSNITEMLHHELSAPVAAITATSKNIKYWAGDNVKDPKHLEYIKNTVTNLDLVVDRLLSIITQLSTNKHIKRTTERSPIKELIDNCVNNINNVNVKSIALSYGINSIDTLENYRFKQISNGDILNILNILIVNSMEAMANKIEVLAIEGALTDTITIKIKDNGTGIRDNYGNIAKDPNIIFTYGYSTKGTDTKKANVVNDSKLYRLLTKIGVYVIDTDISRGIGLALVKSTIENYNGNIRIDNTSKDGTIFSITLPAEDIRKLSCKLK